jgi:Lrp/AsnC family leucine-responsive transcriptional regulator
MGMDGIDLGILEALKENSRATASEIGKKVSLSVPAVAERIRKLEESGVIKQFTVVINREKLNFKLMAFIFVALDRGVQVENFRKAITRYRSVLEVHHITGEYDYLLKVLVEDAKGLEDFLSQKLKKIDGVVRSNTHIALLSIKEEINL